VLVSRRDTRCPALGARVSTLALLHTRFRVHLVENEGVVCDDAVAFRAFSRKGEVGRPVATFLLAGRARLRARGKEAWLEPGSIALVPAKDGIEMRQEASPRYAAIVVEWEPGTLFGARPDDFSVTATGTLADGLSLAERMRTGDRGVVDGLVRLFAPARLDGRPWRDDLDVAEQFGDLAAALDRALSLLDAQPMSVDLENALGLSARQVNRVVSDFNARFGFNAGTWRDARNRRRLLVSAALFSQPRATLGDVARAVGYRSETALCRAFANAGLPSPGSIAEIVARGA
jgi:AraC-like DNA-binding protein